MNKSIHVRPGRLRTMKWDEVARELFVVHARLDRMASDYKALAEALHREFNFATMRDTQGDDPGNKSD